MLLELRFLVQRLLPAPLAVLLQFDLRLDLFLVPLRKIINVLAHRAGQANEIVL